MELVLEILSRPHLAFQKIKERPKIFAPLFIMLGGWSGGIVSLLLVLEIHLPPIKLLLILLLNSLFIILAFVLKITWIHFFAEILGGNGKVTSLLPMLAYSTIPFHFFIPIALIVHGHLSFLILPVACIGLFLWAGSLGFEAIKENYSLTTSRTVLVSAAPALFFFLLSILMAAIIAAIFITQLISLSSKMS